MCCGDVRANRFLKVFGGHLCYTRVRLPEAPSAPFAWPRAGDLVESNGRGPVWYVCTSGVCGAHISRR